MMMYIWLALSTNNLEKIYFENVFLKNKSLAIMVTTISY